jgi:hypothetical protein
MPWKDINEWFWQQSSRLNRVGRTSFLFRTPHRGMPSFDIRNSFWHASFCVSYGSVTTPSLDVGLASWRVPCECQTMPLLLVIGYSPHKLSIFEHSWFHPLSAML